MFDVYDTARWSDRDLYKAEWEDRNAKLLALFDDSISHGDTLSFSEYGCGPNQPFRSCVEKSSRRKVVCYDATAWHKDVFALDLNGDLPELEQTDVGVFSGVLEYIGLPDRVLDHMARIHNFLLLTYYPITTEIENSELLKQINKRSQRNGFRNHFRQTEFLQVIQRHGYVIATTTWNSQLLVLVKSHYA